MLDFQNDCRMNTTNKSAHNKQEEMREESWRTPNISGNLTFEKNGEFDDRFR